MLQKILLSPFFPILGLALSFTISYYAKRYEIFELWILFLPIATATSVRILDFLLPEIDFRDTENMDTSSKNNQILALSIIASGMAIATAIFLR